MRCIVCLIVVTCGVLLHMLLHATESQAVGIESTTSSNSTTRDVSLSSRSLLNQELLSAVQNKNIQQVRNLMSIGADLNVSDIRGYSPLHIASEKGYEEIFELLITQGADFNAKNKQGNTPLLLAAGEHHARIVKMLLYNLGVDVNQTNNKGDSALLLLMKRKPNCFHKRSILRILLNKRANVNHANNAGDTVLTLSVAGRFGYVGCTCDLLKNGASVNYQKPNGDTPLMIACRNVRNSCEGYSHVSLLLKNGANVSLENNRGRTALSVMGFGRDTVISHSRCANLNTISLLVERGADIFHRDKNGDYAVCLILKKYKTASGVLCNSVQAVLNGLHYSNWGAYNLHERKRTIPAYELVGDSTSMLPVETQTVMYQKDIKGKVIHAKMPEGESNRERDTMVLLAAASCGNLEQMKEVLERNPDISARNGKEQTALHLAVKAGQEELVRMLSLRVPNIDAVDNNGDTPLHLAVKNGNIPIVKLLLEMNADVTIINNSGRTVRSIAKEGFVSKELKREILQLISHYKKQQTQDSSSSTCAIQ